MITITFFAQTTQGRTIQKLVGRYDGRFVRNPIDMFYGQSQYCISFEDNRNCNLFSVCQQIINQPFYC